MPRHFTNTSKQTYAVLGGQLEVKLVTEQALSVDEHRTLLDVFSACEAYSRAHPPESPEVLAERAQARARAQEWEED